MEYRTSTINLERLTMAAQRRIGGELAADFGMEPRVHIEEMMFGDLALTLRQEVFAQHLERATVRYHETWRDAVRDRLYAWLRSGHWPWGADLMERRWPIQWHDATIDVKALYPKIGMPHERHSVTVMRVDNTSTEQQRLWFDAKGQSVSDLIHQLYYEGRTGREWAAGRGSYYTLIKERDYNGGYLFSPPYQGDQTLLGMKIVIDPTVPNDTIELRDAQDHIVGKIYNIG